MSETIRVTVQGPVGRVTLCRPPLNVLTIAMMHELADALERLGARSELTVIRLDAEGKAFSAGVDVGEHLGDHLPRMMEALDRLFRVMDGTPVPMLCVVQGAALGGGCEVVLGTDLCIASEKASFGLPEIRLGVFAPPASVLLPRLVGERRAAELLLTGATIRGEEAERIGLVNKVVPVDKLEEEAEAWTARFAELSGAALRHAKRALRLARGKPFVEAHADLGRFYLDELMKTEDANEGLNSFIEKRSPSWKHR